MTTLRDLMTGKVKPTKGGKPAPKGGKKPAKTMLAGKGGKPAC